MDRIEQLTQLFQPVLDACDVVLYELKWLGGKEATLQVSIMKQDGTMDLDTCAAVSEKLSELLDEKDPIDEEYVLEVCSPGAEREIRDRSELDRMTGAYVYMKLSQPVRSMSEITGEITAVTPETLTVEYKDKAVKRTAEVDRNNIAFIRMAVRF
ncbi:MAG: ribosome maturation factor RimP [Solobacterium sp.]|nr:ribosome maturation factor RimP [Solobacterium sp.]